MNKNKQKSKKFAVLTMIFLFLIVMNSVSAQTIKSKNIAHIPDIEIIFSEGVRYYQNNEFQKAKETFLTLLKAYPPHQRVTIAHLMLAKCYYKAGDDNACLSVTNDLIAKYPQSHYRCDAHYLRGFGYYRLGRYKESLREFLYVTDHSERNSLIEKSRNLALKVIDNNITLNEIESMRESSTGRISSAILTIKSSIRHLNIGKREKSIALLQNFIKKQPDNPYILYIKQLLDRTNIPLAYQEVKIGVILPLSGQYAEQARQVLSGIRYAQKKFNDASAFRINLVIKDSEGDIVKAILAAKELAGDDNITAIIGELERDKTVAISAVLDDSNIPFISPSTSGNGVTVIHDYTFQLNPNLESRGRLLAEYAIKHLGLKTFATLAPADNYGKQMTDSFTETIDKLGGSIITQKWYYAEAEDLSRQFEGIREVGFNMMNKDSLLNHFTKDLNPIQKKRFDEETIPVTIIDGIFLPCYTEQIKYIAPQFAFVNIRAQIFGGEYWYDEEELRKSREYVDGVIFCSNYYVDESDIDLIKFRTDFRNLIKTTPGVMEMQGVDAMGIILDAVKNKKVKREEIGEHLKQMQNFEGIKSDVTFKGNDRVNNSIHLLQYKNGRITPLK